MEGQQGGLREEGDGEGKGADHRFERNDINKAVDDLGKRLGDDPRLSYDDRLSSHALLPPAALALHEREARPGLTLVVDVRLGALEDFRPDLEGEGIEAVDNVRVERVEEEEGESEEDDGEEGERGELEVAAKGPFNGGERGSLSTREED